LLIELNYSLVPFDQRNAFCDFNISGKISRHLNKLGILYELTGTLDKLSIPLQSQKPNRMHNLWEETCLELFLNPINSSGYWEVNLSPSGNWNIYKFDAYRQGMKEESAFTSLPFRVTKDLGILQLDLELNLERIIPSEKPVKIAVCAIIKSMQSGMLYWTLVHQDLKPDFHRADSFLIEL
jgi:hypothetical protein